MFGLEFVVAQMELERQAQEQELRIVESARANMSPEAFRRWEDERTAERRHRELCRSIERAGQNARPYNFWGSR